MAQPLIDNFDPDPGSEIEADDSISFDVTDPDGDSFDVLAIAISFGGAPEIVDLVHDGTNFRTRYATNSTRSVIANGFNYSIRRDGGWPSSQVKIEWFAVANGEEAVIS